MHDFRSTHIYSGHTSFLRTVVPHTVLVLLAACGGSSQPGDGSGTPDGGGETGECAFDSSPGGPGEYRMELLGGTGGRQGGTGGLGGSVTLDKSGGTGAVEILRGGSAGAAFTATPPAPDLGANPLMVTGNVSLELVFDEPPQGTAYLSTESIHISDGDGIAGDTDTRVTGVSIATGATLTLGENAFGSVTITLIDDLHNNGRLTTSATDAAQRTKLVLRVGSYWGTGTIDSAGQNPGQNGGEVQMHASSAIYNAGTIDTSGADAATNAGNGGAAATLWLQAETSIESTGMLFARGGASSTGTGGSGGGILLSAYGDIRVAGMLDSKGGDGATMGGAGGLIQAQIGRAGDLRVTGTIRTSGGTGTAGPGAQAANVALDGNGGLVLVDASLELVGGNTMLPTASAGNGGNLLIQSEPYDNNTATDYSDDSPAGDLLLSGNVNLSGGHAPASGSGSGGAAGDFRATVFVGALPRSQRLALLGYGQIATRGGAGNQPGNGGPVMLGNRATEDASTGQEVASGNVTNEADMDTRGGSVSEDATLLPAAGGNGGAVTLAVETGAARNPDGERATNYGAIDTSGGESLEDPGEDWNQDGMADQPNGAMPGIIELRGRDAAQNRGALTASGGNDRGTDGGTTGHGGGTTLPESVLGEAYSVLVQATEGPARNLGAVVTNGGAGEYRGGHAYGMRLIGVEACNSGDFTALGGAANPALTGSIGGNGGILVLEAEETAIQRGMTELGGGAGATAGSPGNIDITP